MGEYKQERYSYWKDKELVYMNRKKFIASLPSLLGIVSNTKELASLVPKSNTLGKYKTPFKIRLTEDWISEREKFEMSLWWGKNRG